MALPQALVEGGSGGRKVSRYISRANLTYSLLIRNNNKLSAVYDRVRISEWIGFPKFRIPRCHLSDIVNIKEDISHPIPKRKRERKKEDPNKHKSLQHLQ